MNQNKKKKMKKAEIKIELDQLPPSSNHVYFRSRNGRMFMSKVGTDFKTMVGWKCNKYVPIEGEVSVTLEFYFKDKRRRDCQNLEKLLFDAMEGYIYHNDFQISEHTTRRIFSDKEKTIISIKELDAKDTKVS